LLARVRLLLGLWALYALHAQGWVILLAKPWWTRAGWRWGGVGGGGRGGSKGTQRRAGDDVISVELWPGGRRQGSEDQPALMNELVTKKLNTVSRRPAVVPDCFVLNTTHITRIMCVLSARLFGRSVHDLIAGAAAGGREG
jgi:hypothetical protein